MTGDETPPLGGGRRTQPAITWVRPRSYADVADWPGPLVALYAPMGGRFGAQRSPQALPGDGEPNRRAARSGDQAWSEVLKRHLDHARTAVTAHAGETIKRTGEGVLAIFTGPGQGMRCAEQVISDARGHFVRYAHNHQAGRL